MAREAPAAAAGAAGAGPAASDTHHPSDTSDSSGSSGSSDASAARAASGSPAETVDDAAPELVWSGWLEQHPLPHLVVALRAGGQGRVLAANAAAVKRYGWPLAELLRLSRLDLLQPSEHALLAAFVAGLPASATAQPQPVWRERTRDGRELLADVRGLAVRFAGQAARLLSIVDAGPRERLAEDAERARELLAVAGQMAHVGGWSVDLHAGRIRHSETVREFHEIAPDVELDLDAAIAFYPGAAADALRAVFMRCVAQGTPFDVELPFVGARGTPRVVRAVGRAVRDASGRIVRIEGAQQDVTAAVELRQRFQRIADAAPVAIYMTDAEGDCVYTNPAWQALWRMGGTEALRQGWMHRVHPDDLGRLRTLWADSGRAGQDLEAELRLLHVDGSERLVLARAKALPRHADGSGGGHVGTITDLSAGRELEEARRAQAVAEESRRRQAAFMSRVSHELRTPLNAILGFGQLLQRSPAAAAEPGLRGWAGHIVTAGQHMLALVDDLLSLQRLEQGRVELRREPLAAAEILERAAAMLRAEAEAAAMRLEVHAAPGLVLETDPRQLLQVLLNLGSNAIKYGRPADDAPPVVRLLAWRAGARVVLGVLDRGAGLSEAQRQRLFTPFERLGQEHGAQPGSGLGLVIARQITALLGGELRLASARGQGTTVTLHLPTLPSDGGHAAAAPPARS